MTAKDYIDTKGYWVSPDRSIRRMGDEGGEQIVIRRRQKSVRKAEWLRICDALKVSLFKWRGGPARRACLVKILVTRRKSSADDRQAKEAICPQERST